MELAQSYPVREDLAVMDAVLDVFLRTRYGAARVCTGVRVERYSEGWREKINPPSA